MSMRDRGNVLVVAMAVLVVLGALGLGAIQMTGVERSTATAKRDRDSLVACAEVGRKFLVSQLRIYGAPAHLSYPPWSQVQSGDTSLGRVGPDLEVGTRHYGETNITQVKTLPSQGFGQATKRSRDITNIAASAGSLGGQYYKTVVTCRNTRTGQETEVEFGIRYGL